MSVEIADRNSAERLELQGIDNETFEGSKTKYTRAFLLTCSELDVCKQLPPGEFNPLVLHELEDAARETHQSWRRSDDLSVSANGKTECSERGILGARQKICRNSGAASLGILSPMPDGDTRDRHSDAPQSKAGVLDQSTEETRETGPYLLRKSDNPYRPPHCHQIQNAKPHLAAIVKSDMGCSPNLHISGIQSLRRIIKNSSEEAVNLETTEDDKLMSDTQSNELSCCTRASNSVQTGSDEWTKRNDDSKPYEFTRATGALRYQTELYDMEDNELTFEDVWSEVSAKMRFEQEMYAQTTDFEAQVTFPDEDSGISTANPSNSELSEGSSCDNGADSDADICLPDESTLISIDHMIVPDSFIFKEEKNSDKDEGTRAAAAARVDISHPKKRYARQHQTVKPLHDTKVASVGHQHLHFHQTYLRRQSPWGGTTAAVIPPLYPPFGNYQPDLMSVPMATYHYWYPWTNMHPSPMESDLLVHYSLQQQPTAFLGQQDVDLADTLVPFHPHVNQAAWGNSGFDMGSTNNQPESKSFTRV